MHPAASRPAALQTTTDVSQQNNTGPLGGPVISQTATATVSLVVKTSSAKTEIETGK